MKKHCFLAALILLAGILHSTAPVPAPPGALASPYVDVTIDGVGYQVNLDPTAFDTSSSLLTAEPWWGSVSLAEAFTTAVGSSLGGSLDQNGSFMGPLFAYQENNDGVFNYASVGGTTTPENFSFVGAVSHSFTYAVATPLPESPVNPGLLAAAAVFLAWRNWRFIRPRRA